MKEKTFTKISYLIFIISIVIYIYLGFQKSINRFVDGSITLEKVSTYNILGAFIIVFIISQIAIIKLRIFKRISDVILIPIYWIALHFFLSLFFIESFNGKIFYIIAVTLWTFIFLYTYSISLYNRNSHLLIKYIYIFYIINVVLFIVNYFLVNKIFFLMDNKAQMNEIYYIVCLLPWIMMLSPKMRFSAILIGIVLVILSAKRGALIAVIGMLIIYVLHSKFILKKNFIKNIFFISLLIMASYLVTNYFFSDSFKFITDRMSSLEEDKGSGRTEIYSEVINSFINNDLIAQFFGQGFQETKKITELGFTAHNDFLEVLYDFGYIGIFIYLLIYYSLVRLAIKLNKVKSSFTLPFIMSITIFLILSSVSQLIIYPTYIIYLSSFWGVSLADYVLISKRNNII